MGIIYNENVQESKIYQAYGLTVYGKINRYVWATRENQEENALTAIRIVDASGNLKQDIYSAPNAFPISSNSFLVNFPVFILLENDCGLIPTFLAISASVISPCIAAVLICSCIVICIAPYAILSTDSGKLYKVSRSISIHSLSFLSPTISHARVSFSIVHDSIKMLISLILENISVCINGFTSYKTIFPSEK